MRRKLALVVILAAVSTLGLSGSASAVPPGTSTTILNGVKEVPGPGDADGVGIAYVLARPDPGQVCTQIRYRDIDAPDGAHIHEGPPTVAGPIVVSFSTLIASSPPGQIGGCVAVSPALAQRILDTPTAFYVNLHNPAFPSGAIRGQLRLA